MLIATAAQNLVIFGHIYIFHFSLIGLQRELLNNSAEYKCRVISYKFSATH